ncbi:MAG: hypothetical protein U1E73_11730 [Planctomycetota bacterium]
MKHALAPLAAVLALAVAAPAQEKPRPPFVFEAGEVDLRDLVDRCAAYLQRNILVNDRELAAVSPQPRNRVRGQQAPPPPAEAAGAGGPTVELQQPIATDRDGCEDVLTSLLWTLGLALVPLDEKKGVYEVLSLSGARMREVQMRAVLRTPEQVLARPALRLFVTCVYPLQHTNAMIANNALRPFFSSNGQQGPMLTIGNMGNSAAVLLTGPQDQVAMALQLLQAADLPTKEEVPESLVQRLEALARQHSELQQRIVELEKKIEKR